MAEEKETAAEKRTEYKLSKKELEILNESHEDEMSASFFYAYLAPHLKNAGYNNAAEWAWSQSKEEMNHAQAIASYLLLRGEKPTMPAIPAPEIEFKGLQTLYQANDLEVELAEKYDERIDDLKKTPSSNMTSQFLMSMLDIQKYSIQSMRELCTQLDALTSKEDELEFDKAYFGPKTECAPMA